MNDIRFDFSEVQKMQAHLTDVLPEVLQDALNNAALVTKGEAVKLISRRHATGRTYQKYNPRRSHKASSAGQAPATDQGALVASIQADTKSPETVTRFSSAKSTAGSTIAYADFLEFGTSSMKKRPFMFPTFLKVKKVIPKLIEQATRKRLKRQFT